MSDGLTAIIPDSVTGLVTLTEIADDLSPVVLSTTGANIEQTGDLTKLMTGSVTLLGAVTTELNTSTEMGDCDSDLATASLSTAGEHITDEL